MADELGVDIETYRGWEETGEDMPISAIYHMARKFDVDFTEILTGTAPKLDTYQVVRRGETEEVDRFPGYHYEDLASRYAGKIMQPLLVMLGSVRRAGEAGVPRRPGVQLRARGSLIVTWGDASSSSTPATASTSTPTTRTASAATATSPAKFVTIIAE